MKHLLELLRGHLPELVAFKEHLPRLGRLAIVRHTHVPTVSRVARKAEKQVLILESVVADDVRNVEI